MALCTDGCCGFLLNVSCTLYHPVWVADSNWARALKTGFSKEAGGKSPAGDGSK